MTNVRWGNDPRGTPPWTRQELHFSGRDDVGFAIYECRTVETGTDYDALWQHGSDVWHADVGHAGHIQDASGTTVFVFD